MVNLINEAVRERISQVLQAAKNLQQDTIFLKEYNRIKDLDHDTILKRVKGLL